MEGLNITLVVGAVIIGGLIGLYIYGKKLKKKPSDDTSSRGKIKVTGNNWDDFVNKMKKHGFKNKVDFESIKLFSYEELAKWINEVDLKDAEETEEVYGCMLVRSINEIEHFRIDTTQLTEEQKKNLYGVFIVNTKSKRSLYQRWIIADEIDDDLKNSFGNNNVVILT